MLQTPTYRPCPACASTQASVLDQYSPEGWQVASCDACDFVYLRNPPDYEALEEDYAWEKTYVAKKAKGGSTPLSRLARWVTHQTKLFMRNRDDQMRAWFKGGNVSDIGCGSGTRIPEPMTPFGIELSNALHAKADANMKARGGYCLHGPGADTIAQFSEDHFDGIIMNSYLEHETEALKVLHGAARTLKPTGKIFERAPNYASLNRRVIGPKWCGFRYPDHVNYFTPACLRALVAQAGFRMQITTTLTLPIDDNINAWLSPETR